MKKLTTLKLKEIIGHDLDVSEMGHLVGGVNDGIMLLQYGCTNDVCYKNLKDGHDLCKTGQCKDAVCSSGAAG